MLLGGTLIAYDSQFRGDNSPLVAVFVPAVDPDIMPGKYIVSIEIRGRDAALLASADLRGAAMVRSRQVADLVRAGDGKIRFFYNSVLIGFSAEMSPSLANAIDILPGVRVVATRRVRLAATQLDPPYGLDRISERERCLNKTYTYNLTGKGAHVYVIDTGILRNHPEFESSPGHSRVSPEVYDPFTDNRQDAHGHGTHVAGTIGGKTYGVAKEVTLHSVRVFQRGTDSDTGLVIKGVDWATENAKPYLPYVVVNMSLISSEDAELERRINISRGKGLTYVVAAGNYDADHLDRKACNWSPAGMTDAITVGALHQGDDSIAGLSFVGDCVDLFAPAIDIMSARNDLSGYPRTWSGASMATAHVSGIAALYLETTIPDGGAKATPYEVWRAINKAASAYPGPTKWTGIKGQLWDSPNKIAHWGSNSDDGTLDGESCPL